MRELVIGENVEIKADVTYQLSVAAPGWEVDALYKKDGNGFRVSNASQDMKLALSVVEGTLVFHPNDLSSVTEHVVVFASVRENASRQIQCQLTESLSGVDSVRCDSDTIDPSLKAIELCHIYRRNGQWKLRSFFQGYVSGVAELCRVHGINASPTLGKDRATPSSSNPEFRKGNHSSHSKVRNPSNFPEPTDDLKHLTVELQWLPVSHDHFETSTAFMGEGTPSIASLTICCLYILKNGQRGLIHGESEDNRGSLHGVPYVDITTDRDQGVSRLNFSHRHAHKMYKYIVCAEITSGSRSWIHTEVRVTTTINQEVVSHRADSPLHNPIFVDSVIELLNGRVKRHPVNQYFNSYEDVATALGFSTA